jgi:hypothetical protein
MQSCEYSPRPTRSIVGAGVVALVMPLGFLGCGDDSNVPTPNGATGDAQPPPGATFHTAGTFDDVPLPRGATEIGTKSETDGAITQSFSVTATSPDQVMDYFVGALADRGWVPVDPVESRGVDSLFGAWARDGRRLEISAGPAPGIADDTQFNLVLLASVEPGRQLNTAP